MHRTEINSVVAVAGTRTKRRTPRGNAGKKRESYGGGGGKQEGLGLSAALPVVWNGRPPSKWEKGWRRVEGSVVDGVANEGERG